MPGRIAGAWHYVAAAVLIIASRVGNGIADFAHRDLIEGRRMGRRRSWFWFRVADVGIWLAVRAERRCGRHIAALTVPEPVRGDVPPTLAESLAHARRLTTPKGKKPMSYTIYLDSPPSCEHCGRRGEAPDWCPDPTYNLTPIFDLALTGDGLPNPETAEVSVVLFGHKTDRPRGLRLLNGKTGKDSKPILDAALARLNDPALADRFTALQPENGWGNLPGAIKVMGRLAELAEAYPANTWRVH